MDDEAENGNTYATFADLMKLKSLGDHTFESLTKPFSPGNNTTAYGGHVFAQAVWAAAQTVKDGFVVHVGFCRVPVSYIYTPLLTHSTASSSYCTSYMRRTPHDPSIGSGRLV